MSATFDREAAHKVLLDHALGTDLNVVLDALAGCVRPLPPQTIDRDSLRAELWNLVLNEHVGVVTNDPVSSVLDRIVALVAPDSRFDTIRALHTKGGYRTVPRGGGYHFCRECLFPWPCATIRALDGDSESTS